MSQPTDESNADESNTEPTPPAVDAVDAALPVEDTFDRRAAWVEVFVVLTFAVFVDIAYSLASVFWTEYERSGADNTFATTAFSVIVRAIGVAVPMLYIMSRSGEPWSRWGIVRPVWYLDLPLGFLLWIFAWFLDDMTQLRAMYLFDIKPSPPTDLPPLTINYFLLVALSLFNGFSEEVVMRGYLIPRFEQLLRSTWLALLITSLLFAAYHTYQGMVSAIGAIVFGMAYGTAFCWLRRLWPIALAHALADFFAYHFFG